jgi:hypothetical protein
MADFNTKRKNAEFEQETDSTAPVCTPIQESILKKAMKDGFSSDKKYFAALIVFFLMMYLSFDHSLIISLISTVLFFTILVIRRLHRASSDIDALYKHVDTITTKTPKR